MATYTVDSLDKLCKQDLIPIFLSLQSKLEDKDNTDLSLQSKLEDKGNTVLEEIRKLNESFSKLHAEPAVTKNANNLLLPHLLGKCPIFKTRMS